MKNIIAEIDFPSAQNLSTEKSDAHRLLEACLDSEGWTCIVGLSETAKPYQNFFAAGELGAAIACAMRLDAAGANSYFGTATFLGSSNRKTENVHRIRCFKADIDTGANDPRKYTSKKEAIKALIAFCNATGLPAPTTVDSGNGVHAYWPLSDALNARDGKIYSEKFKGVCLSHGLKIDVTVSGDIARILRVPGTRNFKDPANPKMVELKSEIIVHDTDEMCALIDQLHAARCAPLNVKTSSDIFDVPEYLQNLKADDLTVQLAGFKPKKFSLILERSLAGTGCNQVTYAYENQISLDEPRWRAALSIAQFCEDRDEAVHQISKEHADYSPEETERKAASILGPMRCETFASNWPEQCAGCTHREKITSPIVLGIEPDAEDVNALADAIKIVRDAEALGKAGNCGAALEPDVIDALREIKQNSPAEFQRLRTDLKKANTSMKALDEAMAKDDPGDEPRNAASALIRLAKDKCTLFHDADNEPHATFVRDGHRECWALNSKGFSEWLSHTAYRESGIAPAENTLATALSTLAGAAKFDGPELPVAVRVAKHGGDFYVDLCDAQWQAVRINASSWKIVESPPIYFVRASAMRALPMPVSGGTIKELWKYVNVEPTDQLILLAWMIECFRSDTPYPVLAMCGESGSAKSCSQKIIRAMIDPNRAPLRAKPKSVEDLCVSAKVSHITALENISHLDGNYQDVLCSIATGAGVAGRTLYTNMEETVFELKRPIMINGIPFFVTQADLMDRAIVISPPTIAQRCTESELEAEFEKQKPQIFGALLTLFSGALKILPSVKISSNDLPRMADFGCLGESLYRSLGHAPGDFLNAYLSKRQQGIRQTIECNPVACALTAWLLLNPAGFQGTVKNLHAQLVRVQTGSGGQWPKTLHAFGDALRRAAPALRTLGHKVDYLGHGRAGHQWQIQ